MSTDIVVRPSNSAVPEPYSVGWVDLVKKQVAKGATDDELRMFLYHCQKTGLDPLARQIYFQKRRSKQGDQMTILTGIDGYRLTAQRTGEYAGSDDPIFDNEENPRKATVTVYRMVAGQRCAFTASARWDQYYPGDQQGFMWRKMPHLMLGKCAEALALRKAFPQELSGIYTREEMEQAESPIVDSSVVDVPKVIPAVPQERIYGAGSRHERADVEIYEETVEQEKRLCDRLKAMNVEPEIWELISDHLMGKPMTANSLSEAIYAARAGRKPGLTYGEPHEPKENLDAMKGGGA